MMQATPLKLALAQYTIEWLDSWADYTRKIETLVQSALAEGSQFLVFPEYFSMELASLFGPEVCACLEQQLEQMQSLHADFVNLFERLACQHDLHILAGTFPLQQSNGQYRNRSWLFRPDGSRDYQDKLQMTRFESEQWLISAGEDIRVLDTAFGKVGIAVCYDSEFPLIARRQVELGADLILVPSCTDTQAGYHRVRIGCQARALENQCFVAQSPTIGSAEWSEAVDVNTGRAGVFAPVDYGYPDDGVVALGEEGIAGWVFAELDLARLADVRTSGQVFNHRDWDSQFRFE